MPILIAIVIVVFSHLTLDKDFPENVKTVAYTVYIIIAILYVLFGLAF